MSKHLALLATAFLISISNPAQTWTPVGSGFNNYVNALYADSSTNRLYAVGNFTLSGGDTMNRVAYWDGIQWNPMGAGFDRRVQDITMYNGEIYVTGQFTYSGSDTTNHIAKWNGTNWENVGGGLNEMGYCMYVFNNNLYVGGLFDTAGTTPCKYVAFWNGSVWSGVDTNITSQSWPIQTIYSYQNELIVGGRFTAHGNIDNIARLSSGVWQPVGGSANGDVTGMQEINGDLYVTGFFSFVDTVNSLAFAKWNGNNWTAIYGPMSSMVTCLVNYNGNIVLGGNINSFVNMGWGQLSPNVANYNMSTQNWSGVDSACGGYVNDLAIMNNTLYAGGSFVSCGNDACFMIAQLDPSALSVSEMQRNEVSVFPNPANEVVQFQFGQVNENGQYVIYNSAGQEIVSGSFSGNILQISTAEFPDGVYLFTCLNGKILLQERFVIAH